MRTPKEVAHYYIEMVKSWPLDGSKQVAMDFARVQNAQPKNTQLIIDIIEKEYDDYKLPPHIQEQVEKYRK